MAGRIPQSFVDELLDRVDIVELIDSRVKLKKSGKNYMACCPFHDEKTPSFSVNADKQFYHCFGCGASGNALGFLIAYEHRAFPEAVEYLAQQQGMEVPRESDGDPLRQKQRQDIYGVLQRAAGYYQEQLRSHPQAERARDYLKRRGLTGQIAQRFGIGYAPPGWDNLYRMLGQDVAGRALLIQAGMLVQKEGEDRFYDRFRDRIMFPIRDLRGRVIAFGGRVLNDDKPKYLNSPETEVFHKGRELYGLYEAIQANRHLERLLVVEGYMDVVALAQFDITYAAATLGTAASETHLEKAFRYVPEVVFCFDGDEAGNRAARRALDVSLPVLGEGRQVRFLFLPQGEDPDTLVRKQGKEAFQERLRHAMPLSEFLFELASEGLDLATPEGRARLVSLVIPSLQRLPEGPYKIQMKGLLAARSQMDIVSIGQFLDVAAAHKASSVASSTGGEREVSASAPAATPFRGGRVPPPDGKVMSVRKLGLLDAATSLLLQQPDLISLCNDEMMAGLPDEPETTRFISLVTLLREHQGSSLNRILGLWQSLYGAEDSNYLYQLAAREPLLGAEGRAAELADLFDRLRRAPRELRLKTLIESAKTRGLTPEEKQELNGLLGRQ